MTDQEPPGASREQPALHPAKPARRRFPRSGQPLPSAPDAMPGQAPGRDGPPPDIGCYEARHRFLTRSIAMTLAAGVILLAVGIYVVWVSWPLPSGQVFRRVAFPAVLGAVLALPYVPYVLLLAGRIAFRADQAGITFTAMPLANWMPWILFAESRPEFIRWSDVKGITLYTKRGKGLARFKTPVIEIWHPRDTHDSITQRSITTWKLDRDGLAAIVAATAPGVAITERGRV